MSYVSLYRKYRPTDFDGMVGQDVVVRALKNQIKTGKVSHAYLFTGTRGTGKTTSAKIFAKAVNCEHNEDGNPCGVCGACLAIAAGTNFDILEIDAASNNGVDEIRDLRDMVKYAPAAGKYKVFIIDEVHMLSSSAHNALLKTLEEPPEHVIFILATTEAHKLPQTILSRCQRFDFRLIPEDALKNHILDIFKREQKEISDDAAGLIAAAGEGSARDALSVADVLMSYSEGAVSYKDVLDVLGANSPEAVIKILKDILDSNAGDALLGINESAKEGKNISLLASDLSKAVRHALFIKNANGAETALGLPHELYVKYAEVSAAYANDRLMYVMSVLSGLENSMKGALNPRLILESAALKAANAKASLSSDAVLERVRELENKIENGIQTVSNSNDTSKQNDVGDGIAKSVWGYVIKSLRQKKLFSTYSAAAVEANKVSFSGGVLRVFAPNETDFKLLSGKDTLPVLEKLANEGNGRVVKVEITGVDAEKTEKSGENAFSEAKEILKDILKEN